MSQHPPAPTNAASMPLSPTDRRRIAVAAGCHPECVVRYLRGIVVRSTTRERIERALRNADLSNLIDTRNKIAAAR